MAVPYPPSVTDGPTAPVPDTVDFSPKKPGSGNYMPSKSSKVPASKTADAPAANGGKIRARVSGETVTNGLARFDNSNILDGVGDGVDQYTTYLGDGSTGQGWPDQSRWVSFENMFNNYKNQMFASCGNLATPEANDSGPEVVCGLRPRLIIAEKQRLIDYYRVLSGMAFKWLLPPLVSTIVLSWLLLCRSLTAVSVSTPPTLEFETLALCKTITVLPLAMTTTLSRTLAPRLLFIR